MPGTFTYNAATNTVTVTGGTSGSPADFASFLAADRAGSLVLLDAGVIDADPDTFSLTTQPRPCEKRVLKLKIIASADRAGATLDIAGTDGDGDAISETGIDISGAATAPVYTTLKFAAVGAGGITVHGLTNGDTVTISQDQWGVIWNNGNGQYQIGANISIGNASTATYFGDIEKLINLAPASGYAITLTANSSFRLGLEYNSTRKTGYRGCALRLVTNASRLFTGGAGNLFLYGSLIQGYSNTLNEIPNVGGKIYDCIFDKTHLRYPTLDINNVIIRNNNQSIQYPKPTGTFNKINIDNMSIYLIALYAANAAMLTNTTGYSGGVDIYWISFSANAHFVDCDFGRANWLHSFEGGAANTGNVFRQYTFSLHVTDADGVDISGAIVNLQDANGDYVWAQNSLTTDANGLLPAFSGIGDHASGALLNSAVTHTRYFYSGSAQSEVYNNFVLTISKAGYQDYVQVITIDRKLDLEVALSAEEANQWPQCPVEDALEAVEFGNPAAPLVGVYHEAAAAEVEKDVAFGPNSAYLGTLVPVTQITAPLSLTVTADAALEVTLEADDITVEIDDE
jgi:hypothetical protein